MNETTGSASMSTKIKEGVHIKGKDVIFLDSPEIYFPEDAPLDTEKRELYDILNELFQSGSGGGDDWQPPDIPEPSNYEIYFLIEIIDVSSEYLSKFGFLLADPEDDNFGKGELKVDWGDGTTEEWDSDWYTGSNGVAHKYNAVGRYTIKVTATTESSNLRGITFGAGAMGYAKLIGAKLGSEITVVDNDGIHANNTFTGQVRLQYIKMSGKGGLTKHCFYNCYALRRIDIANPPDKILEGTFYNCINLTKFDFANVTEINNTGLLGTGFASLDFPKCVTIGSNAVSLCPHLKTVSAPLCTAVGYRGMYSNYVLETADFSENCIFGNDCFSNCYSLYPRPDGSIN